MRPTTVGDAASALKELIRAEEAGAPYGLVLLDGRMPDVDGITLAGQIMGRYGPASKRLILLSSDDSPILAARSRAAGIRAYLLKPVQQSELLETIWVVMKTTGDAARDATNNATRSDELAPGTRPATLRILVVGLRVDIARLRRQLSADETVEVELRRRGCGATRARGQAGEESGDQNGALRAQQRLLQHTLKLPNVAWPIVRA